MTSRGPRNLIALDLLRFGCALIVLAFHWIGGFAQKPMGGTALHTLPLDTGWTPFVSTGWIGVEIFFVLSGFVIAWSAEGSSAASFAHRRMLRLVPAAWLCATVTAGAVVLLFGSTEPGTVAILWLGSVLFWPMFAIDQSYWTLGIEVNFYLLVTLTLLRGTSLGRIERFGGLLGLASAAYWVAWCFVDVPPAADRMVQLTLLPHGCFFALGILIRTGQRLGARPAWLAFLLAACVAAWLEIDAHWRIMNAVDPAYFPPTLLFASSVLLIAFAERIQPLLSGKISPPASAMIGLMTYPLYLLHQKFGTMLIAGLLDLGAPYWPAAALTFAITLALSWAIVRFGEPRVRTLLAKFGGKGAPRPLALEASVRPH